MLPHLSAKVEDAKIEGAGLCLLLLSMVLPCLLLRVLSVLQDLPIENQMENSVRLLVVPGCVVLCILQLCRLVALMVLLRSVLVHLLDSLCSVWHSQ